MMRMPHGGVWSSGRAIFAAIAIAMLVTIAAAWWTSLSAALQEDGPIELVVQLSTWFFAACFATAGALWAPPRQRGILLLLAALGAAAGAREADLHAWLRPEAMGAWGFHFRLRWWVSATTPVGPRLLWGGIIVTGIVCGQHLVRQVLPGMGTDHRWMVPLLVAIVVAAGLGAVCDDLLRHRVPHRVAQVVEETSETVAALVYAMIVGRMRYLLSNGVAGEAREEVVSAETTAPKSEHAEV